MARPIRDMAAVSLGSAKPVRRFTWRARQERRPGLLFMVWTRRHHGFESLEEMRLLSALGFLAVLPGGAWLFDVRPGTRSRSQTL